MSTPSNASQGDADAQIAAIRKSGLDIYQPLGSTSPLYLKTSVLENLLGKGLKGFSTSGMPPRTRSKAVKMRICESLGYPIPASFKRTKPRFFGQNFDVYIQKSDNLQIWNEPLVPDRRYVLIREQNAVLVSVRVVTGQDLAKLENTGTLTQKYQARLIPCRSGSELISSKDTSHIEPLLAKSIPHSFHESPAGHPEAGKILPIKCLSERLNKLVGRRFHDLGGDQDRNHGAMLQRLACEALGYARYADNGQFPDIPHQLLEIKLQTAQTIDLGGCAPNATTELNLPQANSIKIRNCDVRYAVFTGIKADGDVTITGFYLSTGRDFFSRFPQCGGLVLNKKLQIPLPGDFFHPKGPVYA